ncbi:unnamed protein product [Pseudo-nitzschia multistriata]|uniref:Uncharacterized protein n=1 Tax=Pseudo-nitzschia multistriata TaxID=183589 RepID=A0A448YV39_9STRA|nr:unnamed protein product [Pseudo-nitzschia multistriata]
MLTIDPMTTVSPTNGSDEALLHTDNNDGDSPENTAKKPSLLRNQLLRRTTTRCTKHVSSPEAAERMALNSVAIEADTPFDETQKDAESNCEAVESIEKSNSEPIDMESATHTKVEDNEESHRTPENPGGVEENDEAIPGTATILESGFAFPSRVENDEVEDNDTKHEEEGVGEGEAASDPGNALDISDIVSEEGDEMGDDRDNVEEKEHKAEAEPQQPQQCDDNEEECKAEAEQDEPQPRPKPSKQSLPPAASTGSTVSTTNLSIVVTGHDIVVEYHDDKDGEHKEASPGDSVLQQSAQGAQAAATPTPGSNSIISTLLSPFTVAQPPVAPAKGASTASSARLQEPQRRPKGIMKRPRDSNITYHHPRRPLPPPLPPPGFKGKISSLSWSTDDTNSNDALHSSTKSTKRKRRVSFDEVSLSKQSQMSLLRRQARYREKHSISGILTMTLPVLLPYLIAVLILVASSMVPLPTPAAKTNATPHELKPRSLPGLDPGSDHAVGGKTTPIFDIASRMWDQRKKSLQDAVAPAGIRKPEPRTTGVPESEVVAADAVAESIDWEFDDDAFAEFDESGGQVAAATTQAYSVLSKNPFARAIGGLFRLLFRRRRN